MQQSELKQLLHYDAPTGIFRWRFCKNRHMQPWDIAGVPTKRQGYIKIMINRKSYLAHRLAWLYVTGSMPKSHIDHINGDKADNRIQNLREADNATNHWNEPLRSTNKSGHKGVWMNKNTKKWQTGLRFNGVQVSAGIFENLEDAASAIRALREKCHGEYANHGLTQNGGQHGTDN